MELIAYCRQFGLKITLIKALRKCLYKSNSRLAWWVNKVNEHCIRQYLTRIFEHNQFDETEYLQEKIIVPNQPIWVMWLQGIDDAPDIVKCCIKSIQENSNGHEVIIITEKNYNDYVSLPDFILQRAKSGHIAKAHLSDIIRVNLLYIYGGAWLDATVFVSDRIPNELFERDFYSIHFGKNTKDPSHGRWTTFLMIGKKHNTLFQKVIRYHYLFWKEHSMIIDYVMFDYIIDYCVREDQKCRDYIEAVEVNNQAVFDLRKELNLPFDGTIPFDKNTIFYKLSWKEAYMAEVNNKKTIYASLVGCL